MVPLYRLKIQDIELERSSQGAYLLPFINVVILLEARRSWKCTRKAISGGLDIPNCLNTTLTIIAPFIGNLPV